jgi:cytochrome c553
MKTFVWTLVLVIAVLALTPAVPAQQGMGGDVPPWAYLVAPPNPNEPPPGQARPPAAPPVDEPQKHVPNSTVGLTPTQVRDGFNTPDWHPEEHPAMAEVIQHGRKPDVRACGWCHMPNGSGRPENAGLAGLPASYIALQIADLKNEVRKSSNPRFGALMPRIAKAASDAEVQAAAEYFASLKPKATIRVVEADMVPKTKLAGMLVPEEGGGTEPIGMRIIEAPENPALTELRDEDSGFVAYVPKGSLKKGEALVTTGGGGKTIQCSVCHGTDLKGLGPVPRLAGRSPSYIFRQLYDMQHGSRKGVWADLMKEPVARLTLEDMVSISAYAASLKP